jgi:hypothetical protein
MAALWISYDEPVEIGIKGEAGQLFVLEEQSNNFGNNLASLSGVYSPPGEVCLCTAE